MNTTLIQYPAKIWYKLAHYCLRSYQGLIQDPRVFVMKKLARFEIVRDWATILLKRPTKSDEIHPEETSILGKFDVEPIAETIETDSCYQGFQLPEDVVQELLNFASYTVGYINRDLNRPCRCKGTEKVGVDLPENSRVCSYMSNTKLSSTVKRLEKDPGIRAIAAKFLGAQPVHMGSEISWSFPVAAGSHVQQREAAQVFHYDLDDYRFIKFFSTLPMSISPAGPTLTFAELTRTKSCCIKL